MATAVLTRDPADCDAYARALAPLGLDVVAMPVTHTASAPDSDALVRALADGGYSAIVVASARAAAELGRAQARANVPTNELPPIWSVGPATQRALVAAGLSGLVPDDVRDGAELATRLASSRDLRGERILVPRAEEGRTETLDVLRDAGAIVVDVVAYRTLAVAADDPGVHDGAELLITGRAAVCALFAPSQVVALAAILSARGRPLGDIETAFCAIGETTAATLRERGIRTVAVASAPSPEGMAHAVGSVYPPKA